ncbi:aldehyde dehydrogenase family protein [Nocardioides sambongensis]|uniref:aldehyde dehydrogenase family protein n=1 Tax=Nocardioides sambongensis TaxID=2589074 RepID=UPI001126E19C|nr:aldehyde dehydrogenase family protein [Nocardioides sambongensis]
MTDATTSAAEREPSQLFIDGRWAEAFGRDRIRVEDPATEQIIGEVPDATKEDVDAAVAAARRAFGVWSGTSIPERKAVLQRFASSIADRREALAHLVTREMGTPIGLSRIVQADLPVSVIQGFAKHMDQLDEVEHVGNSTVVQEPAGVVGAITPWNYPIHQAVGKVGAALAAGCTVVLKPSEVTPLSAFLLAEAAREAGLPDGALNVITGSGGAGQLMAEHPDVDVISFTGSTSVGRRVLAASAGNMKRSSLELGGKSANVVLPDADLATAVHRGVEHVLENSGQTCTAWTRMLVPVHLRDDVVDLIREAFEAVVLGDPLDESTTMGPLATARQREIVQGYVETGQQEGAIVAAGSTDPWDAIGHYVRPVGFVNVHQGMRIAREEIFGPVLSVLTYSDESEALAMANDSVYGLSGAVWSSDRDRAYRFARKMRTGQVSVNGGSFNPEAPFGGYKQSGIGRELGRHGLQDFLELKAIQL